MILPYATTSDVIVWVEMVFRYLKELKTTHTISEESCIKFSAIFLNKNNNFFYVYTSCTELL